MTTVGYVPALGDTLDLQVQVFGAVEPVQLGVESACPGWSIRDVMNHSLGVTVKFADFAAGMTDQPHAPPGDLLRPDHRAAVREVADQARRAWAAVDRRRRCQLAFGTFPADLAAGINLFDTLAHTWDVAAALGLEVDGPDRLWEQGLDVARTIVGPTRDLAHYDPELPSGPGDPPAVRLLRFLGRDARS